jgi:DNA polymerase IV
MPRTILHLDLDAFFCAVEEQHNPSLRGLPFAVGGRPEGRGVVASCSYPARRFGVHSAMPMARAVKICPNLIVVPPHFKAYRLASQEVMKRLNANTPLVEQISIDEAFLDVTGISDAGEGLARRLQAMMLNELGLPCSFGVATNKLVAKIANNIGKASAKRVGTPNAIQVVPPGQEAAFLAPLPILDLWGIGPKTAERLTQMGIQTIGDLARRPANDLERLFGKHGAEIAARARGIDERPVETEHEAKSISREITFARDVRDGETLRRVLRKLADGVGWRVRKAGFTGTTVKVKLRWSDFTTLTRQVTMPHPVDQDDEIYEAALHLFEFTWPKGRPIRLIGVGVSGLEPGQRQLSLWDDASQQQNRRLQSTLDALKNRFGEDVIQRGSDLKRGKDSEE